MPFAIFRHLCPNCGSQISAERLEQGLACEDCLPSSISEKAISQHPSLCELLRERNKLQNYRWVCYLHETEKAFESFFREHLGFEIWSLQRVWARRVLLGESFALVAPTGVGKTTFGIAMAHFLPGTAYIIVPTRMLVEQVAERCQAFGNKKVVAYLGRARERKAIETGDYEILITTCMFLSTSFELLNGRHFNFVFVDDVDALLKSGKNVDKVLKLLGFSDEEIETAWAQVTKKAPVAPEEVETEEGEAEEIFGEVQEKENEIEDTLSPVSKQSPRPKGILVVSSATLRPRTKRVALFRTLLGFEVAPVRVTVRNICDAVKWVRDVKEAKQQIVRWIKRFGAGGVVFVSGELGREGVAEITSYLRQNGIAASPYDDLDLEAFQNGKIEVAVGIAIPTNALVRGVDLPETIRYAIFVDVPKISFPLTTDDPRNFVGLLLALREVSDDKARIDAYLSTMRQYRCLRPDQPLPRRVQEVTDYLRQQFGDGNVLAKLEKAETVTLHRRNGQLFITFGDAASYLQASGRTSRLFAGGISRGISLVLAWDKKAFYSLTRRLRLFYDEVDFADAGEVDWEAELRKVDEDRQRIKQLKAATASISKEARPEIRTTLVIVESPNKARTIAHFFGTPQRRIINGLSVWEVTTGDRLLAITASLGHVFDLVEREGIYGVLQLDSNFVPVYGSIKSCPNCGEQTTKDTCSCGKQPERDKLTLIQALQRVAVQFDEIVIATDPDAEGEKIGYDLMAALKPFNPNIVRVEFHEVTRRAFTQTLQSPREIEQNLVKAQVTRRILDRWVGFELSRRLWKVFDRYDLSAGRVQTPVLGWVIERTDLARQKKARISIQLADPKSETQVQLTFEHEDISQARKLLERLEKATLTVTDAGEEIVNPPPPYNTGTLLADAGSFASATQVMDALQDLFERGLITYHRTDSVRVSEAGLKVAEELLRERYNLSLFQPRRYGTEGAHECIRPTRPLTEDDLRLWISTGRISLDNPSFALRIYGMIVRRFLASQMKPAKVKKVKVSLQLDEWQHEWELIAEIVEEGFNLASPLRVQPVTPDARIVGKQIRFVSKVVPFTQGSLIEEMRQRGLGRPSTYAKIVQTLIERGYIAERKGFLFATELGRQVYQWLRLHFPEFADEALTKDMEEKGDKIETGELDYQSVLWDLRRSRLFSRQ